jgi:hypothetical protein
MQQMFKLSEEPVRTPANKTEENGSRAPADRTQEPEKRPPKTGHLPTEGRDLYALVDGSYYYQGSHQSGSGNCTYDDTDYWQLHFEGSKLYLRRSVGHDLPDKTKCKDVGYFSCSTELRVVPTLPEGGSTSSMHFDTTEGIRRRIDRGAGPSASCKHGTGELKAVVPAN